MARIFVSYAHEDKAAARRIVDGLARQGLDAWWDHEIPPGRSWDEVIGARIAAAQVVIVIWSKKSVASNFVKEEAQLAYEAGKLLPVKVDEVEPPVGFRRLHAANLVGWRGEDDHRQWQALLGEARPRLGVAAAPQTAPRPPPKPAPNRIGLIVGGIAIVAVVAGGLWYVSEQEKNSLAGIREAMGEPIEPFVSPDTSTTIAAPGDERAIELQFWKSCCDRSGVTADDYDSYLSRYPAGEFASIAGSRLDALNRAASPPPAAPFRLEPAGPAPVRAQEAPSISGTTWSGSYTYDTLAGCTFSGSTNALSAGMQFKPDGTFYAHPLANDGQWTQYGFIITVTGSNQTRVDGVLIGNSISGRFTWTAGGAECRGTFSVTRN